ncbi:N-acetylneuraminate synthase [Pedobacter sp. P351]|uniref:N-acetylneuraminate synthase n=1 Tax=Pedobacter superstes TaxID=3133441 RepID=UPI0030AFD0E6
MRRTLIIAEAGVNHNGNLKTAKVLIDAAARAGVDFVKFQTFKADKLVSPAAQKAEYQNNNTGIEETQLQMLKKLELTEEDHNVLVKYCSKKGINFLSTAFDLESLDFLYKLGIRLFKIPSGEITNLPYLEKVAHLAEEIILSTGMSNMLEIGEALTVLQSNAKLNTRITVLHCNTDYPTPYQDVNLMAMESIKNRFGVNIGYSDHTLGIEVPIAAVALGANVIEKHFTLDRTSPGPDHSASLEPDELKAMVTAIRNIESALGSSVKEPSSSEKKNIEIARKSIHLIKSLTQGDSLKESDLIMLRPGNGISPMRLREVIGKTVNKDLAAGSKLRFEDLE